jgi:hypothetical protein
MQGSATFQETDATLFAAADKLRKRFENLPIVSALLLHNGASH